MIYSVGNPDDGCIKFLERLQIISGRIAVETTPKRPKRDYFKAMEAIMRQSVDST
jgi:hypothetical protein